MARRLSIDRMAEVKSIRIVGGGLAGLALGIGLRQRQIPVHLIEAGHYPRHRVCGEVMSMSGQIILKKLEINTSWPENLFHRTVSWWSKGKKFLTVKLPQPSLGLSRFYLDQTLSQKFSELGGQLQCGQRFEPTQKEGEVLATGRSRVKSHWYGLKVHLKNFNLDHDLEMHLGKQGYVGISRVEEGWINLCGLFYRSPEASLKRQINEESIVSHLRFIGLGELAEKVQSATKREESQIAVAGFQCGVQRQTGAHSLTLGDRDRMIPPFTGHGMSMALESAWLALDSLELFARGNISWYECLNQVKQRLAQRFHKPMRNSSFMQPFLTHPLGQNFLRWLCASRLFPFSTLFHGVR